MACKKCKCSENVKSGVLLNSTLLCTPSEELEEEVTAELKNDDPDKQDSSAAIAASTINEEIKNVDKKGK